MVRPAFVLLLSVGACALGAEPDEALEKARAKFQQDIAKAEEGLNAACAGWASTGTAGRMQRPRERAGS